MSTGLPPHNARFQRTEDENDPVWKLLGQSPLPEPDAWFTVRTLARCRHAGLAADSRGLLWSRFWHWTLGTGLGICLTVFVVARVHPEAAAPDPQKNVQEAFEIMASIGDDSDSSPTVPTSSSWQDSSL
jgi:hypothetical protein